MNLRKISRNKKLFQQKLRVLAEKMHKECIAAGLDKTMPEYTKVFAKYNREWVEWAMQRKGMIKPKPDQFKKYIQLCQ